MIKSGCAFICLLVAPLAFGAAQSLPDDRCSAMNVVASALVMLKYEPKIGIPTSQRTELLLRIMADDLQQLWSDEQERKNVVASIIQGGPYASTDEEATSAGFYYDLKCRIAKLGHPVRDYVMLTPALKACWLHAEEKQVKECFIHEMSDGLASPPNNSSE